MDETLHWLLTLFGAIGALFVAVNLSRRYLRARMLDFAYAFPRLPLHWKIVHVNLLTAKTFSCCAIIVFVLVGISIRTVYLERVPMIVAVLVPYTTEAACIGWHVFVVGLGALPVEIVRWRRGPSAARANIWRLFFRVSPEPPATRFDSGECVLCLEEWAEGEPEVYFVPCGHRAPHLMCISQQRRVMGTVPRECYTCRGALTGVHVHQ